MGRASKISDCLVGRGRGKGRGRCCVSITRARQCRRNLDGSTITAVSEAYLELGPGQVTFPTGVLIKLLSLPN